MKIQVSHGVGHPGASANVFQFAVAMDGFPRIKRVHHIRPGAEIGVPTAQVHGNFAQPIVNFDVGRRSFKRFFHQFRFDFYVVAVFHFASGVF